MLYILNKCYVNQDKRIVWEKDKKDALLMSRILAKVAAWKRLWKMEIDHTQHGQHCPSCRGQRNESKKVQSQRTQKPAVVLTAVRMDLHWFFTVDTRKALTFRKNTQVAIKWRRRKQNKFQLYHNLDGRLNWAGTIICISLLLHKTVCQTGQKHLNVNLHLSACSARSLLYDSGKILILYMLLPSLCFLWQS